jgi:hypothetical protein
VSGDDRGVHLEASLRAHRAMPKPASITWPLPADRRLDQLVGFANEAGAATHRAELTAALVAAAPVDAGALLGLVLAWRRSTVKDVVINVPPEAEVIYLPRYGPGRRKSSSG